MRTPQTYLHPKFTDQLRSHIVRSSPDKRGEMLRQVSDLFIEHSEQYSNDQVDLFDDVLVNLAAIVETEARAVLAERLAPLSRAPRRIIRLLAFDDAVEVAVPVLAQASALDEETLAENARSKSQQHLLAISRRTTLSETVTDVLVERGHKDVLLSAASNSGAKFSGVGFATLVRRSEGDDRLAACLGKRPDIPAHLLRKLLATASEAVRTKLQAESPSARQEIDQVVADITERLQATIAGASARLQSAQATVEELHAAGRLNAATLETFANSGNFEESMAALALLGDLPVDFVQRAMRDKRGEMLLIIAKAIGLSWPVTKRVLRLQAAEGRLPCDHVEHCLAVFDRLKRPTARRILDFYRARSRRPQGEWHGLFED